MPVAIMPFFFSDFNRQSGFLLIFLTAGNLIAIGDCSAPSGVQGQRPGGVRGAAPLEAIRFSQNDKVTSTQPVMHQ